MSTTFSVTRDQIIQLALIKLGVLEIGDTPDAATIQYASLNLNLLLKQMNTEGLKLWKNQELVVPMTSGMNIYTLGGSSSVPMYDSFDTNKTTPITDKPLKLLQAFYRNNQSTPYVDTPLQMLSKKEYNELGSKLSQGVPNSIFYDYKTTYGSLYAYTTPNTFVATNYNLHVVMQMPISDINKANDVPDFPNEWFNVLVWNLADQMAVDYSVPQNKRVEIVTKAKLYKDQLDGWDVDTYSTFFQPDFRMYVSGSRNTP
jgi:hypothetical protein